MLSLPNCARGPDIRQALDWLILACRPPPTHGDIWHSLFPQALREWACVSTAAALHHSLITRAASHLPSCVLDSPGSSQTLLSVLPYLWSTPVKLHLVSPIALWWGKKAICPPVTPRREGAVWGSHSSISQRNPSSDLSLDSLYGRETEVCFFVISLWHIFQSGLFYNSLWYLILLVSCVVARTSSVAFWLHI